MLKLQSSYSSAIAATDSLPLTHELAFGEAGGRSPPRTVPAYS
ncbi:hypothetical protein [Laspinema sp. D2d]|nr:hypothetical protein [Laspinema sp. D2d]